MKAIKYGYDYLRRPTLKLGFELTRSHFKRPLLVEALEAMEKTIKEFRIVSSNGDIIGAAPRPENLARTSKLLFKLRRDYQYEFIGDGLAIPVPPVWGKDNNPHQWWNINDYEILSAAFRHEVEIFLRSFSSYLPKGEKELEPTIPRKLLDLCPTVSGLLSPKKPKGVTFPEAPPISSITSSTRLGAIINTASAAPKESAKDRYPPRQAWNVSKNDSDDPFNEPDSPEEIISIVRGPKGPPNPPSDSSDSDDGSTDRGPPKIPPRSTKRPLSIPIKPKEELSPKTYHFDMKLKPETVPTWDGNENTLARWIEKVGQLANTSPDIFRELGKVVPRRFTNSAETWYYSIPPKNRQPMEQDWGTLKTAIADYWMNHSWLEDQKFRANNARYRETGHACETPSEYVI